MLFLFICTEGDSSEPGYIRALKRKCSGQAPNEKNAHLEIIPLPLGGNQGHRGIFERADEAIGKYIRDFSDGNEDVFWDCVQHEKWLICDYDNMNEHDITEADLRKKAEDRGFNLVINKPNFEFFILLHFYENKVAYSFKPREYEIKTNEAIEKINSDNALLFGKNVDFYVIPKYTKRQTNTEMLFDRLLEYGPVSLEEVSYRCSNSADAEKYSNMGELIERIAYLFSD